MAGRLIVIEGTDGAGKATQAALLVARLREAGRTVQTVSFPRYDQDSSWLIRQYLAGELGSSDEVPPKAASAFFAFDRLMASPSIKEMLARGEDVVLDRWVGSNKGHQMSKITGEAERQTFLDWINNFEYTTNGLPVPELTILLYLDPSATVSSSEAKGGVAHDVHEMDASHLKRAAEAYRWVATHDTVEHWHLLECADATHRLTQGEMSERVWQEIKPVL